MKLGSKVTQEEFIGYLFHARNCVHLHHLKVKGEGAYAAHVALGDLYDGLLDLADTLSETAQTNSLLNIVIPESKISGSPLTYVEEVLKYIRAYRNTFPYSFQQNEIDTMELLLSKTIYKLRFLQ